MITLENSIENLEAELIACTDSNESVVIAHQLSYLRELQSSRRRIQELERRNTQLEDQTIYVRTNARPIVEFAFGNYNRWRHSQGGRPTLQDAYEYFRRFLNEGT